MTGSGNIAYVHYTLLTLVFARGAPAKDIRGGVTYYTGWTLAYILCLVELTTVIKYINLIQNMPTINPAAAGPSHHPRQPLGGHFEPPPPIAPKLLNWSETRKRQSIALESSSMKSNFCWPLGHLWRHRSGQNKIAWPVDAFVAQVYESLLDWQQVKPKNCVSTIG